VQAIPLPRDPLTRLAAAVLFALLIVALLEPLWPFGNPSAIIGPRLADPGPQWPLGTDSIGRAILPRIAQGIRNTILLAVVAIAASLLFSTAIGMLAGYKRGIFDMAVVRIADSLFSFPSILLAILVSAIVGPGVAGAVASIVLVTLPLMVRVVRAATLTIADRDFVVTAEVGGASLPRILFVHVLPNIAGPLIVQATYALSVAMLVESGLSFLGLGMQPPDASLGSLVSQGNLYLVVAPWLVFAPGAVLALAILSVNLLGDGLRDMIDPRAQRVLQ
jgi:peptide/nickel transport system permease protein